ncbi:RNA exonuclease, putative [Candida dubliniensis CD36]|uniref:RNA exonuclease 3 n=1 Tax=Candida dubliniensis (strain CD36 / ATCC MYA-646 / CBS 7987 / NCPF 3949 / NRRL Y-17841) TaxID=573826 RepID=B9W9U5_CANDC|nr:RNA exonuclease, putative [Candida dubliniensis CD36]CAX45582.1 RNA exonuclease, putative [Candida dubliniensis CD36]
MNTNTHHKRSLEDSNGNDTKKLKQEDPKYILPKQVNTHPATLPERKKNIEYILNILTKKQPNITNPKLKAIEIEYEIAKKSTNVTYKTVFRQEVFKLTKPVKSQPSSQQQQQQQQQQQHHLNKVDQEAKELKILKEMIISRKTLIDFGYIMDPPESKPNEKITRICSRCGTEFRLDQQLQPIVCEFHHGKKQKGKYLCCMSNVNGQPCSKAKNHVYLLNTPEEKQALLPYKSTKELFTTKGKSQVLGIDCEMGFTTKGFELMRITAIDYFTTKTVLDIFIKPIGEIVDLNTRYSGIHELTDDFLSWEQSMKKLGEVMDSETILIGHGLENDMNAMRLIHENIIDTSILFPSKWKTGPNKRWSLKDLAFEYLSRKIQTGEHDSGEDSIAAIDIVKHFVKKQLTSVGTSIKK